MEHFKEPEPKPKLDQDSPIYIPPEEPPAPPNPDIPMTSPVPSNPDIPMTSLFIPYQPSPEYT